MNFGNRNNANTESARCIISPTASSSLTYTSKLLMLREIENNSPIIRKSKALEEDNNENNLSRIANDKIRKFETTKFKNRSEDRNHIAYNPSKRANNHRFINNQTNGAITFSNHPLFIKPHLVQKFQITTETFSR